MYAVRELGRVAGGASAPAARTWALAAGVLGLGAVLSAARLLIVDPEGFTDVLWAEDGLFALCARAQGAACLADPYAGYLPGGPRLAGALVALFAVESWALAANVLGALLTGVVAAGVFFMLRTAGYSGPVPALVGFLPVLAPIVGLESVGSLSSMYMLGLFAVGVATSLPFRQGPRWLLPLLVLLATLSIPTGALLVLPLWVHAWRRRAPLRLAWLGSVAAGIGLLAQVLVMLTAVPRRSLEVSWELFEHWVGLFPSAVLSWWPGVTFGVPDAVVFGQFEVPGWGPSGAFLLAVMVVSGLRLGLSRERFYAAPGLLLLLATLSGAVPSLTGFAGNRYFVAPMLLAGAAVLMLLDRWLAGRGALFGWLVAALLVWVWSPSFAASPWRAESGPVWPEQVLALQGECAADPVREVEVFFAPDWPTPSTVLTGLTVNRVTCSALS